MTEPLVSVGIVTEKEIRFDLYGEFTLKGLDKKISGRFKAKLNGDKISIYQEKKEITF